MKENKTGYENGKKVTGWGAGVLEISQEEPSRWKELQMQRPKQEHP